MLKLSLALALALVAAPLAAADRITDATAQIESEWAQANFATADNAAKLAKLDKLIGAATELEREAPGRAEPLVWRGVLLSTKAGVVRGLTGYSLIKDARAVFERAIALKPDAAGGRALRELGTIYYLVPGAPWAFGDRNKARSYLERARALDPGGLASNLAYADFLVEGHRYAEAVPLLELALKAPVRADQPTADNGWRSQARALLAMARARIQPRG
jgi:tetratricopeptide (TPR) repeat protein